MARGVRKSMDEKIAKKEELIQALECRIEKEKSELEEMYQEKKEQDVKILYDTVVDARISPEEARTIIENYVFGKETE